jgi:hypothetical protein
MPINLEAAAEAINRILPDVVVITRLKDEERVWDDVTMQYVTPEGKPSVLYSGPGMVGNLGPGTETQEGRQNIYKTTFSLRTPLGSGPRDPFQAGDVVRVTKADLNKALVGTEFRITEEISTSFAVSRRMIIEKLTGYSQ